MSKLLGFELRCRQSWETFNHVTMFCVIPGTILEKNPSQEAAWRLHQWAYCPDEASDTFIGISVLNQLPLAKSYQRHTT